MNEVDVKAPIWQHSHQPQVHNQANDRLLAAV